MKLEPWVPPGILFGWWFRTWELWGDWLVHIIVPPMGLQTFSAPWVLSLCCSIEDPMLSLFIYWSPVIQGYFDPPSKKEPQSSQGGNHPPKSTHGRTHDSSLICSRGWPFQTSMRGEVIGPVKDRCPSVGNARSGK